MEPSDESDRDNHAENCEKSMAYLTALNAVNLMLLDTATFQRNNYMVYTSGLTLALKQLAEGNSQGVQILDAIQKSLSFDQAYILKASRDYVEILREFNTSKNK